MSGLPAIVTVNAPSTASATPVKEASLTTERNLFEYLSQQSLTNSLAGNTLANPSALATQLSRHLRGFMERAGQQSEISGKKGRAMSHNEGTQTINATQAEGPQLHAGPARERLSPFDQGAQSTQNTDSVSEREYDDFIGAMMRVMEFAAESQAIMTSSSNTTKSMNTLVRGQ
jgi:hypothetical protein